MNRTLLATSFALLAATATADSELTLQLGGTVAPVCAFEPGESGQVDLTEESVRTLRFEIYCNTEMSIGISSSNGGLLNVSRAAGNAGAPILVPYTATVALSDFDFSARYSSAELLEGVVTDVGGGVVFSDTMGMDIELDSALKDGYAGEYQDRIDVTVFPSLAVSLN